MIKFHLINVKTREILYTIEKEKDILSLIEKRDILNKRYNTDAYCIKMTNE